MKRFFGIVILGFTLLSFTLVFEIPFSELIKNKLENYSLENYPEKVYVHTDKPFYSLGETIWYSTYLVNGINHLKSKKSYVLYVDIINEKDSIVDQNTHFIHNISNAGNIDISKEWDEGKYLIRAYTSAMRNESSDYFFQKEIAIWDASKDRKVFSEDDEQQTEETLSLPRPDLNFYPEGGDFIAGIENKIAIKIKDNFYRDSLITGTIQNSNGDVVTNFKTLKFGLGLFSIIPEENETYSASIFINDSEERYPLPKVLARGFKLHAANKGSRVLITLSSTLNSGLKDTYLVAHQRGRLVYEQSEKTEKRNDVIVVPTESLDDGVLNFTLFNASGNPVCERLVFVENSKNNVALEIDRSKPLLNPRQQQVITINSKDLEGNIVASQLSMTVRDLTAIPQNNYKENIKTWLLLNSDLRGGIQEIGYFFEKENDIKRRYLLDLTMLTHGWRRFSWNRLLSEEVKIQEFPVEKGIYISGVTQDLKSPFEKRTAATRATFLTKTVYQEPQQSDSLGKFEYGPFVFFDSVPTLIEARLTDFNSKKGRDRKLLILLDDPASSPKVSRKYLNKGQVNEAKQRAAQLRIAEYIKEMNFKYGDGTQNLKEVVVVGQKRSENYERNKEMNERTLYGTPSDRVVIDDVYGSESLSVFDLLVGISGVYVSGNSVSIRGGGSPAFYLDGMEIDSTFVSSLSGNYIDFIDVLKGVDANTFMNSSNGVIAMYSKTGANVYGSNIKRKPGIIDFVAKGFYTSKEFYAPDYLHIDETQLKMTDVRTTLYWEPDIRISDSKKAEISFFTCDSKGEYIIEVEGISDTGIPIFGSSTFTVE